MYKRQTRIVFATVKAKPCNLFILGVYMLHKMGTKKPLPADTLSQLECVLAKVHLQACIILLEDLDCKLGRNVGKLTGKWCEQKYANAGRA